MNGMEIILWLYLLFTVIEPNARYGVGVGIKRLFVSFKRLISASDEHK